MISALQTLFARPEFCRRLQRRLSNSNFLLDILDPSPSSTQSRPASSATPAEVHNTESEDRPRQVPLAHHQLKLVRLLSLLRSSEKELRPFFDAVVSGRTDVHQHVSAEARKALRSIEISIPEFSTGFLCGVARALCELYEDTVYLQRQIVPLLSTTASNSARDNSTSSKSKTITLVEQCLAFEDLRFDIKTARTAKSNKKNTAYSSSLKKSLPGSYALVPGLESRRAEVKNTVSEVVTNLRDIMVFLEMPVPPELDFESS